MKKNKKMNWDALLSRTCPGCYSNLILERNFFFCPTKGCLFTGIMKEKLDKISGSVSSGKSDFPRKIVVGDKRASYQKYH